MKNGPKGMRGNKLAVLSDIDESRRSQEDLNRDRDPDLLEGQETEKQILGLLGSSGPD